MTLLKIFSLGFLTILATPSNGYAADKLFMTSDNIFAAANGQVVRQDSISIATDLASCAGLFDGLANFFESTGDTATPLILRQKGNVFHNAAIVVWSKHGTEFDQISSIRTTQGAWWHAATNIDMTASSSAVDACNNVHGISVKVVLDASGGADSAWK